MLANIEKYYKNVHTHHHYLGLTGQHKLLKPGTRQNGVRTAQQHAETGIDKIPKLFHGRVSVCPSYPVKDGAKRQTVAQAKN